MLWRFDEYRLKPDGSIQNTGVYRVFQASTETEAVRSALYAARLDHPEALIGESQRGIIVTTEADGTTVNWYLASDH